MFFAVPPHGHGKPRFPNLGDGLIRRVNAGGQKVGLPMIITGGRQKYDEWHWLFNTFGRVKKKPKMGEERLRDRKIKTARREFEEQLRYWIKPNYCGDCDEHDRPSGENSGGFTNFVCIEEPVPDLDLRPGMVIICTWCQRCVENYASGRTGKAGLLVDPYGNTLSAQASLALRMNSNIIKYLRVMNLANRLNECLPSPEMVTAYKG